MLRLLYELYGLLIIKWIFTINYFIRISGSETVLDHGREAVMMPVETRFQSLSVESGPAGIRFLHIILSDEGRKETDRSEQEVPVTGNLLLSVILMDCI